METEINQTSLKMEEISDQLFNLQFLSDITFIVEEQPIYAHSLELMKRSSVFQEQFESTFGTKKIVPITDYGYEIFYQFIRFIYTDEYTISEDKLFEMLKLARAYNVIRLINDLYNSINDELNVVDNLLKKFNFCVVENYEMALNSIKGEVADALHPVLQSYIFLKLHPLAIEEILKFDHIDINANEIEILEALMHWITRQSIQQNMEWNICREIFNNLIHLIRFPTMTDEQLRKIKMKYPKLLPESDFLSFAVFKIFGTEYRDKTWNCQPRLEYISPYDWTIYPHLKFETIFTVSSNLILCGIVFGTSDIPKYVDITISSHKSESNETSEINLRQDTAKSWYAVINLGTSILLRPGFTYTIGYQNIYLAKYFEEQCKYLSRKPQTEIIIKAPPQSVHIMEAHATMFEMFFVVSGVDTIDNV